MTAGDSLGLMHEASDALSERRFPPIAELAVGALALIVVGGIYMAASFGGATSLALPIALVIGAGALLLGAATLLSRLRDFAWRTFRVVFGWALLAYLVIAGMIEYAFVADGTPGRPLLVLTFMLAIYAADIPMLLAFSVARYQEAAPTASG
jgi:hypothetical protein